MTEDISIDKLTRVYLKMRDKKAEVSKQFEAELDRIDEGMRKVKTALLDHMKEIGAESLRTESGLVYRTVRTLYTTSDWESMNKFILEHGVPDLLEKRLHQTNTKAFLEEHPDLIPPGLNANSEYSVTIKRSK
jgi:hypothetical protein